MFILMSGMFAYPVKALDSLVIDQITVTGTTGSHLFVGDICTFQINLSNPNPAGTLKSDRIIVTLTPQVDTFDTITKTIDGSQADRIELQFQSWTTGPVDITAKIEGQDWSNPLYLKTVTVNYYNFATSIDIQEDKYYPTEPSLKTIKTTSIVENNGNDAVEFTLSYLLKDSKGVSHPLIPCPAPCVAISMSPSGTPPAQIPTTPQFNITIPAGSRAVITSQYIINVGDPTGAWEAKITVKPSGLTQPKKEASDSTNVMAPQVDMQISSVGVYKLGDDMKFRVLLVNGSDVEAVIEELKIEMFDANSFEKLKANVPVRMSYGATSEKLGMKAYGISVGIGRTEAVEVSIELEKDRTDGFNGEIFWDPKQKYTLKVTGIVQGATSPLVQTKEIELSPFDPDLKVSVKGPLMYKTNQTNDVYIRLINAKATPVTNMVLSFYVLDPDGVKITPNPSEVIGINIEGATYGGTTGGNMFETVFRFTPTQEGTHVLKYCYDDNKLYDHSEQFYVSTKPESSYLAIKPEPSLPRLNYELGSKVVFTLDIYNDGTSTERYTYSATITTVDGGVKMGTFTGGSDTILPGETQKAKTIEVPTSGTYGLQRGNFIANVELEYDGDNLKPEQSYPVMFKVIAPSGRNFTVNPPSYDKNVVIGNDATIKVYVVNNQNDTAHFDFQVMATNSELGFGPTTAEADVEAGGTYEASFVFHPREGAIGRNVVRIIVNGKEVIAEFNVITQSEQATIEAEESFWVKSTSLIIIAVVGIAVILGGIYIYRRFFGGKKKRQQEAPRERYQARGRL